MSTMVHQELFKFLSSSKLAMALLVIILACCLLGVTVWKGVEAGRIIFSTLWFNGLLVLLVFNVAFCFFPRIYRRRLTIISFGMILFHVSFVVILLAIVYNSLFYFRGLIRLTEGEALPSDRVESYDAIDEGFFFKLSKLKGETSLIKMHTGYRISGEDKRAAYEVAVGDERNRTRGIIYITHSLTHRGFEYFNDREGYSLLLILYDKQGRELHGAHVPLQSRRLDNNLFEYFTGYRDYTEKVIKKEVIPFPPLPGKPIFALITEYLPSKIKERGGNVVYRIFDLDASGSPVREKPLAEGKAAIGEKFKAGDYFIEAKEVRYWVAMMVRHEPGKPIVLGSLWTGLAGMIITTIGRMLKRKS